MGSSTASTLQELAWVLRLLPARWLHDATLSALRRRTSRYPDLSLGDFLARVFHDWDNVHGLTIDGGGVVFGDGHVDEGVTRQLALAAVRAGINDVEAARELGAWGSRLTGEPLYRAVQAVTGTAPTTVGDALADMLQPDGYFIRQLDCLGQGLVEAYGLLAVPMLGDWLSHKGCQAYHHGFVDTAEAVKVP